MLNITFVYKLRKRGGENLAVITLKIISKNLETEKVIQIILEMK